MNELNDLIKKYSINNCREIKEICRPLIQHLDIPHFTYYFVEENGRFGTITNNLDFMEFYYFQKLYLTNPFMSHPGLFRSGYMYCPCTFDSMTQEVVMKKVKCDHLLLSLECRPGIVEGFCFNGPGFDAEKLKDYLTQIDLLKKFTCYFKKEASHIIENIQNEHYNIKKIKKENFFEVPDHLPLINKKNKSANFLKDLFGLSPQEQRCLELFKEGHTAQASAAKMGLSQRTVEHYLDNIKIKLNCNSKWDLLNF